MRAPIATFLLALSTATVAETSPAAAPAALDPRVEAALRSSSVAYTNDEGDFRLIYSLGGGRTQVVWVASATARIMKLELRDVWSLAYRGTGQVPAEMAKRLLTENARMVLGAWQVNQSPDKFLVVYLAQIPADADATSLQEVIEAVAVSADRIEQELTGADEF
ncbi:MAG TPA: hypothetical protein VF277_08465 [Steroidobacteraceae bacterium]